MCSRWDHTFRYALERLLTCNRKKRCLIFKNLQYSHVVSMRL